MTSRSELESAFDAAIEQIRECLKAGMPTVSGEPATSQLEKLEQELTFERARTIERGSLDRDWFQRTLRGLVDWLPETELALIAALGRIVRSAPK
ncbi:MAG TPA: hypothetical protein VGJ47_05600 [Gemmatimonadaceae bacterium]|jgi:hypothetical protein